MAEPYTAKVVLIDGREVTAILTTIEHVGNEGSRRATAHYEGKEYPVYHSIDEIGIHPASIHIWYEQQTLEEFRKSQKAL